MTAGNRHLPDTAEAAAGNPDRAHSILKGLALAVGGSVAPALDSVSRRAGSDSLGAGGRNGRRDACAGLQAVDGVDVFKQARSTTRRAPAEPTRFRRRSHCSRWSGVLDATMFGPSAPQHVDKLDALSAWYATIEPVSEDCLHLNVFAPSAGRTQAKRPVMVWLHGGGWWGCAGTAPGFDGTRLAQRGDVVVVTVNHRLNLFGYLYLGDADERFADAGNAGILDLVAALRWVRENIAAFGGDPDKRGDDFRAVRRARRRSER